MKTLITLLVTLFASTLCAQVDWTGAADNNIDNFANWGTGVDASQLPTTGNSLIGTIGTGDTVIGNADIADYQIIQDDGSVTSSIRWDLTDGSYVLNDGSFTVGSGEELVLNGTQTFTVNGGTFNVANELILQNSGNVFSFNGGTSSISDGYRINGGRIELGGTTAGTVSFDIRIVTAGQINWLSGSQMAMSLNDADWAEEQWTNGNLTYQGLGVANIGNWAAVSSAGGLGNGESFSFDGVTNTLTIIPEPSSIALLGLAGLAIMVARFRKR